MRKFPWKLRIGLEVHARITSNAKLFSSGEATATGSSLPNSKVTFFDAAHPGTLPVVNKFCIFQAIRAGISVNAKINHESVFERKHYFYPDSPLGYQITQQRAPIVSDGCLDVDVERFCEQFKAKKKSDTRNWFQASVERIQLEHDTGKTIDQQGRKFIDLNRMGFGVLETVTAPEMQSSTEAAAFIHTLLSILKHHDICEGDLSKGDFRFDVNVSIHNFQQAIDSHRVEIKNLNSLKHLQRVVDIEEKRLLSLYTETEEEKSGEEKAPLLSETRTYSLEKDDTVFLRYKDTSLDYRFLPDPDLPHIRLTEADVQVVRETMPELYDNTLQRLKDAPYRLPEAILYTLINEPKAVKYFELVMHHLALAVSADRSCDQEGQNAKAVAGFICNELLGLLHHRGLTLFVNPKSGFVSVRCISDDDFKRLEKELVFLLPPKLFADCLSLWLTNEISKKTAAQLIEYYVDHPAHILVTRPADYVLSHNLYLVKNGELIQSFCRQAFEKIGRQRDKELLASFPTYAHPTNKKAEKKKVAILNFFVGKVMHESGYRVDPTNLEAHISDFLLTRAQDSNIDM